MYQDEASTSNSSSYSIINNFENDSDIQYTGFSKEILMALLDSLNRTNETVPESRDEKEENISSAMGVISPLAMRISLYLICIAGILLNLAVFCKRKFTMKRQSFTTRVSLGLLCFMAIADTISLASLLLVLCTQYLGIQDVNIMGLICKIDLFLIHTASAFSIWCWLVLSAVRYVALYRPYAHLRLNKEPMMAVCFIAGMCGIFESWILYDATFVEEHRGCGENFSEQWEKRFQIAEICWSYFLPLIVITVLDIKVLCCHSIWFSDLTVVKSFENSAQDKKLRKQHTVEEYTDSPLPVNPSITVVSSVLHTQKSKSPKITPEEATVSQTNSPLVDEGPSKQENVQVQRSPTMFSFNSAVQTGIKRSSGSKKAKRRLQQMKILRRCLCITLLDLGMNLPNYLFRLYVNIVPMEELPDPTDFWFGLFQEISQLLYFAQFSLNAFYLICIIYDTPKKKQKQQFSYSIKTIGTIRN